MEKSLEVKVASQEFTTILEHQDSTPCSLHYVKTVLLNTCTIDYVLRLILLISANTMELRSIIHAFPPFIAALHPDGALCKGLLLWLLVDILLSSTIGKSTKCVVSPINLVNNKFDHLKDRQNTVSMRVRVHCCLRLVLGYSGDSCQLPARTNLTPNCFYDYVLLSS